MLQNYPNAPGREALLNDHMMKWFKVRRRWKEAAAKNEERYKPSMDLLKEMFEKWNQGTNSFLANIQCKIFSTVFSFKKPRKFLVLF